MGVSKCELCGCPARIHCESDQANLCWECDAKVHGANFLVARHSRCLLCRSCQSPTPWRAEGSRLGATVSVCHLCAATSSGSVEGSGEGGCSARCVEEAKEEEEGGSGDSDEEEEEEEMEEEDEESESGKEEDDIDEGDNQVVPWSPTPPPVASSSSSGYEEEESDRTAGNSGGFLKRMRENADLVVSQDDLAYSSSRRASDPVASATATAAADEIQSFTPPFGSFRDRKRAAHSLPSPAPSSANATTANLLGIRVGNGNHRQGVNVMTLSATHQY
ncbi:uncharacterized protein LOC141822214 [Curcuma longa]|uniref:uncharacterized protein LOC141822214 n=1 Tax=Curcuma longa TaxID=136217 RepID=UPI003D9F6F7B